MFDLRVIVIGSACLLAGGCREKQRPDPPPTPELSTAFPSAAPSAVGAAGSYTAVTPAPAASGDEPATPRDAGTPAGGIPL